MNAITKIRFIRLSGHVLTTVIILLLILSVLPASATQQGPMEWSQSYGGSKTDGATNILQTADGDFILTGWTKSGGAGGHDALLVKINADGEVTWSQTYGGADHESCLDSLQTDDGSFYLTGYTTGLGAGWADFMLLKLDSDYQTQWVRAYGGSDTDAAASIIQDPNEGLILVGSTRSGGAGGRDALLVKTDEAGELNYMQTYGGKASDDANTIIPTVDNGFALVGWTMSYGNGGKDAWLVKIDESYQQQWIWTYGGPKDEQINSIIQTADGGYILAGTTTSYGAGSWDALLIKIKSNGQTEWIKTYGGDEPDVVRDLVQTADGGYVLMGGTVSSGSGLYDFWLIKTDAHGNMEWDETYGGADSDYIYAGIQAADGGFALAGTTYSLGTGDYDVWLVKTPTIATTTTTKTGGLTFVTMPPKTILTISKVTPVMSYTTNPNPILTDITLTKEPESPFTISGGPMEHLTFATTFETAITFTAGPITGFETTTSTPMTTPDITTLQTTDLTAPTTSQAPVTVTVTDTEADSSSPIPGFMSLPALIGLSVIVLVFRKLKK